MSASKPKILLIDDELANLQALERTLKKDFEISLCQSPQEGLRLFESERFDVIVTDQRMPQMLGTELLSKAAKIRPQATRVILTGFTETAEILDAINRAEIYRYITKPWNNSELIAALTQAAEHSRLKLENLALIKALQEKNQSLEDRKNELTTLNAKLEGIVLERTAELLKANEQLSALAMTDPLTNLHNRRSLFKRFGEEIDRSLRYKHPISIAMIDVDHFKQFNDMEGHVIGDEALKKLAHTLLKNLRKTDFLARYGGEEFVVLMPETPLDVALDSAERLRSAIESTIFQGKKGEAYLTISVGLAGFPEHGEVTRDLIQAADQALYEAKQSGRNRVSRYGNEASFFTP